MACGAGRIIALEPNPQSFTAIQEMLKLSPQISGKVTLINQAVSSKPGSLRMGLAEGEDDSSTSGIMGDDFTVTATTLSDIFSDYELVSPDLIKIDIEGAEALLADDFRRLSHSRDQVIHLSVHVPMFPDSVDKSDLADAFGGFNIQDDRGELRAHEECSGRLLCTELHPKWGTRKGNFFEVLLKANG